MALASRFDLDPAYGTGVYRRRIRLKAERDTIKASVIDDYHEMACSLRHDGHRITAIEGRIDRSPYSTCPAAPQALQELVGLPLTSTRSYIYGQGRAQRNCTHLFDIAALGVGLALSGERSREFAFSVPDETERGTTVEAWVDGALVHRWTLRDETIVQPVSMVGRFMFGGFAAWALTQFEGGALDAALQLQKVVMVARGRRYKLEASGSKSLRDEPERQGACFTFSEPNLSAAKAFVDYIRDFSAGIHD